MAAPVPALALTRRRFAALAGLAALAPVLEACGASSSTGTGTAKAAGTPVRGGTAIYAVDTEPVSWDVHASSQDITGEIQRNVFDSLVAEDADGVFHPWLASSWTVSSDLKTYTFDLRQDVKFTDGTAFDAQAVKVNFDRIVNPATKSDLAASLLGPYTGTTVVDAHTVRVEFSEPFAPFLQAASTAYLGFYSPAAISAHSADLGSGGAVDVGTGPFTFTSYTKGESAVFARNPDYAWPPGNAGRTGAAYLDGVTVRFLAEDATRVGALSSGQVQAARALPPVDVKTLAANQSISLVHKDDPGGNYLIFMNANKAPFDDVNVRKAVLQGINVAEDVQSVYFGQYQRAWSPLSSATPDYDASLANTWSYDPTAAGALLDQAGWTGRDAAGYRTKDGKTLTLDWPVLPAEYITDQRDILGQAVQADLKKIGIQINRPAPDIGTYLTEIYGGKTDFIDFSWSRFEPDVLWLLFNGASTPSTGGQNATFINDPDLTAWTNQGRATLDAATRKKVYAQVQQRVIEQAYVVPVYVPQTIIGVSSSLNGLAFDPQPWALFYNAWLSAA
jgi:peptide/nickel transport system substrate-binding protein